MNTKNTVLTEINGWRMDIVKMVKKKSVNLCAELKTKFPATRT